MLPVSLQTQRSVSLVRWLGCAVFALSFFSFGCGEKLPPLAPVKGKITGSDGKAVKGAQVSLFAEVVDASAKVPPSNGKSDDDGNYEINTGGKAGAPLGKFKITVTPDMSKMGEKGENIDMKYRSANTTTLKFEVVENAAAGAYDLKLTK